ncbi:cation:proton antiporter [Lentzea sp. NPDC060358]|uniref:cation:proton antiporter n=1 Tax=Lentzea sp. NPDC060358 TaxID=3347103 RepID=UPI003659FB1C
MTIALGCAAAALLVWSLGGGAGSTVDTTGKFMLAVTLVLLLSQLCGRAVRLLKQPPVVGEVLGGLLLGPSVLGLLAPSAQQWLFPAPVKSAIQLTAQLGLVAFIFLLGWEQDVRDLRSSGRGAGVVALTCLVIPFGSGLLIGVPLMPELPSAFFLALALSITALPVLARILHDVGMEGTRLGKIAVSAAVLDDAACWAVLAAILPFAGHHARSPLLTVAAGAALVAVLVFLVRPFLEVVLRTAPQSAVLTAAVAGALGTATITEMMGLHSILGAFLFGLVMPRRSVDQEATTQRIKGFTVAVLLPLFFAYVGMNTSLQSVSGHWGLLLLVLLAAVASKFVGGAAGARLAGLNRREATVLGVLMNCRGITELVVANLGLGLGLIDGAMFAILVVVALLTTAMTTPALTLLRRREEVFT